MNISNNGKVLVIENDLFFTSRITETLKKLGLTPVVTIQKAEVFKLIKQNEIVLLIIDLSTDGIDTVALLDKLKSGMDTGHIPIIGFAEHTDTHLLQGARQAGCDMVVSNRSLVENLKELVEASLST